MSDPVELNEIHEDMLWEEIERRRMARIEGLCDYCGREPSTPECQFPMRHRRDPQKGLARKPDPEDPLLRLCQWLAAHPAELGEVARHLEMPLPACEGFEGPCSHIVLWRTSAMTAYPWDGEGPDPNRPMSLCPECSAGYRDHWKEMWDDYYSGLL